MDQQPELRRASPGDADPGGGSALPGAVIDPASAARTLAVPAADADFLLQVAAHAGLAMDHARATALASQIYASVAVVRRASPPRRDLIVPATVFRAPREV